MFKSNKKIIGIVRGGDGQEYKKSIYHGGQILKIIQENFSDKWQAVDVLIDKNNQWYFKGLPVDYFNLTSKVDILWNFTHSKYFANLENFFNKSINDSLVENIFLTNKDLLKKHFNSLDVNLPRHFILPAYQEDIDGPKEEYIHTKAREILRKFTSPWIIKSFRPNINMAIHLAKTFPELIRSLEDGLKHKQSILVEEFISGKIITVHLVAGFRNEKIYIFPVQGLNILQKNIIYKKAKIIFDYLHIQNYLKIDFLLDSKNKIHLLNMDFSPDLSENSNLLKACDEVGASAWQIVEHIVEKNLIY